MPDPEAAPLRRTEAAGDDVLLDRLRQGDADAFEALVRREMPRLLATARRLLRSEEDAKDAVQETFVSAFRSIGTFEGAARLSTWLHRIAVNACLMKLRSRRRRPEDPIEPLLPQFLEDGHHTTHTPEWRDDALALMERREEREFVRARIDDLPESYRTVLILRDIEELEPAATAAILGVSENLVKVRLHRARQALRALLEPRYRRP
jgi:RNA polymerase sigma-70 factor (ECF subfamily)